MKKTLLLFALLLTGIGFSQEKSLNDYKYVIVPEKFEFLKEANKYNLNDLTKMVFEKYGFTVFYPTDHLPDELALDRCKALYADLQNDSGLLVTALYITLKDCNGKLVFTSEKGKSKIKDFKKAYYEALRDASGSLALLNYKYSGNGSLSRSGNNKPDNAPDPSATVAATATSGGDQLFAQPITNGYQLVDTTPKVVLRLYKTSNPESFTAVTDGRNGIVFKRGNDWIFEYYQNDQLVSEKLNIKF